MAKQLSLMEEHFKTVEHTILPIYKTCANLQLVQHSLECTLGALDSHLEDCHVAEEVRSIVYAVPGSDLDGLGKLLAAVRRIQKALNYFEKHNPQSVDFAELSSMFVVGGDALHKCFELALFRHSRIVASNILLDAVSTNCGEALNGDDVLEASYDQLPSNLSAVAEYFTTQQQFKFTGVYIKTRAAFLMISYNDFKKEQIAGWKANAQGMDSSSEMFLEVDIQKVDREEMEKYFISVKVLQRLMQNEWSLILMTGIIPLQYHQQVFQSIIEEALSSTVEEGLCIINRAKQYFNCRRFDLLPNLLFLIRGLMSVQPKFDQILEGCGDKVRFEFTTLLNHLRETTKEMLNYNMTQNFKSILRQGLPKDVAICETTISVLETLEKLMKYADIIGNILREDSANNDSLLLKTTELDKNQALLGMYIIKVLSELDSLILLESKNFMDIGVRALFRLVNYQHVLKVLLRSPLLKLVDISQPHYLQTYVDKMETHKKYYKQCWNKVLSYIIINNEVSVSAKKLEVKEKFSGFIKEFEEVYRTQCECSISDVELREGLRRDNKEYILPKYSAFYNKFSKLIFSKNLGKYGKYTPDKLDAKLTRFFELEVTTV